MTQIVTTVTFVRIYNELNSLNQVRKGRGMNVSVILSVISTVMMSITAAAANKIIVDDIVIEGLKRTAPEVKQVEESFHEFIERR